MEIASKLSIWFLLFLTYSVIGWCIEVLSILAINHKLSNRGFLLGPVCPIYGFGAVVMSLLLAHTNNIFEILLVSIGASAIIEYFTSYLMEKMFRVRWWDYSKRAFNLHGRICLANLVAFGVLGVAVVCFINPLLFTVFNSINPTTRIVLAAIFFTLLLVDLATSLWLMIGCRVAVGTVQPDATDEITAHIRDALASKNKLKGKLNRRLTKAFPDMSVDQKKASKARIQTSAKKAIKAVKAQAKGQPKKVKTAAKAQAKIIKAQAKTQAKSVTTRSTKHNDR